MSYLALARKWRPRTFSQLLGQEHITKAIINSIKQDRLHHAYLFSGTRGVGKTSVARLLAKALNCSNRIEAEPCLQCENCLAIEQGSFIDLIEIDGASKTRVEDTRELLDNVQYNPTNARFKIYLIDEVHMLSQHSFNALLKTLEEPPAHVKFLLATTEPQKLPVTVLSRCLQFNLKHLTAELIAKHLEDILVQENILFEKEAIQLLASAAKGSMRDSLSLLDQTIATIEDKLTTSEVKRILGYTQQDYAIALLAALQELNAEKLISISRSIAAQGGHFRYALESLLDYLHQLTLIKHLSNNNSFIPFKEELKELAPLISNEDIQLFYQIGIKGLEEMHLAPNLMIGFEMALLRMFSFKPANKVTPPPLAFKTNSKKDETLSAELLSTTPLPIIENGDNSPELAIIQPEETIDNDFFLPEPPTSSIDKDTAIDNLEPFIAEETFIPAPKIINEEAENQSDLLPNSDLSSNQDWASLLNKLKLTGLALNAAENAEFVSHSEKELILRVSHGHSSLFTPKVIERLEEALANYYSKKIKISLNQDGKINDSPAQQKQIATGLRLQNAENALNEDPHFQQLKQAFSAELIKNSVDSLEDEL
ncbi:MAG: DNA polymerase III subunit gamma/tau [Proteobacteria bacterium]|nr:DNA polymerase III subunit gamma/tau [Pseudomonadota bacterium]